MHRVTRAGLSGCLGALESFVGQIGYLSSEARRVQRLDDLPRHLARLAAGSEQDTWCAWQHGERVWFVQGRPFTLLSRRRGLPVMSFVFRDVQGSAAAAGVWQCDSAGRWSLSRLLDTHPKRMSVG